MSFWFPFVQPPTKGTPQKSNQVHSWGIFLFPVAHVLFRQRTPKNAEANSVRVLLLSTPLEYDPNLPQGSQLSFKIPQ